jgi:hypothetical protein
MAPIHCLPLLMVVELTQGAHRSETMGATAIVPSGHLLSRDGLGTSMGVMEEGPAAEADRDDWSGVQCPASLCAELQEHKLLVPLSAAGSYVIVHEDMIHRATPRIGGLSAKWRPMFKVLKIPYICSHRRRITHASACSLSMCSARRPARQEH